jgi:thiol-disulfide isomerase/thioredoxin
MTVRQQIAGVVALVFIGIVGVASAKYFLGDEISPLGVGAKAPTFSATTLTTPPQTKTLANYKNQVVFLNIWATWCPPCRAEMPSIEKLQQTYGTKGLKIVAVSIDEPGNDAGIRAFAKDLGLTFEILHDGSGAIERAYQTTGVPETVIIGRDGVIRKKIAGATDWDSPDNQRLITNLLAE